MKPETRLVLCIMIIIASSGFAVLVARDPNLASALASGYVAVLLTWFVLCNLWKKQ
jgi:hypothetical protein